MSKPEKIAVIGGTLGIGGYMVYDHHKKTGSWNPWNPGTTATGTTSDGTATSIDPITGMAYSQDNVTDPITGETYLAEATEYGSVATAEASVTAYGASTASGSGIGVNPASPPASGSVNTVVGSSIYTSNSAWAQAATAGLADVGYVSTDVATALGDYLTGTPVTAAQASLINTAIAEYGPAPVGTLQIVLAPVSTASTTTTGSTGTSASTPTAKAGSISNLEATVSGTTAKVSWNSTPSAATYSYELNELDGTVVKKDTTSSKSASFSGLHKGWTYNFGIQALPGGPGDNIHITIP